MSITLTPEYDPLCRQIAEFLAAKLSTLEPDQVEVASVLDYDAMASGTGLAFPVLAVYRLRSEGLYLEQSILNIDYYLYSVNAYAERPGILRLVEVAIAHLIKDVLPVTLADEIRAEVVKSDRGFLKFDSGEIFPFTRLQVEATEVNVQSPVV